MEWANLAKWCRRWNVQDLPGILIGVQLPRIYPVWRKKHMVASFGDFLRNFWGPILDAAAHPSAPENADIIWFLRYLRVIDTVDDESKEDEFTMDLPSPDEWTGI